MLKVQEFLHKYGLEYLKQKYSIETKEHEDGRILLNYSQINSPKMSPIVRECRGLCLDNKFNLVSRSFFRFFNYYESRECVNKFIWENSSIQSKEDGTLLIVYFYNGWKVQTRGSFGNIPFYETGPTPTDLFNQLFPNELKNNLNEKYSYSFELCSLHNKIVRLYNNSCLYLLSIFEGERELSKEEVNNEYEKIICSTILKPEEYKFNNIELIEEFIREKSRNDKTFEGIVISDVNNTRLKVKNPDYLALHRIGSDKACLFAPRNLIGFVLDNETDELLSYFAEAKPAVEKMKEKLDKVYSDLESAWSVLKNEKNRKTFALAVQDLKCNAILFRMFGSDKSLRDEFRNSREYLLKFLESNYEK